MQQEPRRRDDRRSWQSGLVYGLIFGSAIGLLASTVFELDLALGLVFGAAIGIIAGLVVDGLRRQ